MTPDLKKGSGGIFDVHLDGRRVFSKHETGKFPVEDDLLDELAEEHGLPEL